MNRPVCSVLIANYNGDATLAACIDSVLAQDCDAQLEIIVHDDASSDASAELVATQYPDVSLIRSDINCGFCESNNRMARAAHGEFLLLLNNDAALRPDAVSTLLAHSQQCSNPTVLTLPQYALPTGELMDRGSRFDLFMNPVPNLDHDRRAVGMGMGACLWIPRPIWDQVGGFPTWFGSLAEDMYLCVAARTMGYGVEVCSASGYDHWVGASLGGGKIVDGALKSSFRRRALSERNKTFVMCLFLPLPVLLLLLPLHLLSLLLEGLLLSALKRDLRFWTRIYWPCLRAIFATAPLLRRQRAALPKPCARWRLLRGMSPIPYKFQMLLRHGLPQLS